MQLRRNLVLSLIAALPVAPGAVHAQAATPVVSYDSLTDSTHLTLVTHKGKYFLWIQKPRLTWSIDFAGREYGSAAPAEVWLVFRTQNPQAARDNHLILESPAGERLEVTSVSERGEAGPMVWNHFMRFPIPTAELARALAGEKMRITVGGIRVDFRRDQVAAMRQLLGLVGAWPAGSASGSK